MDIWIIVIILLVCAVVLLGASFFVKDKKNEALLAQVAEWTLPLTEELKDVKKRLATLEKETGMEAPGKELPLKKVNDLTKRQIIGLFEKGLTYDAISEQLALPETTVQLVVDNHLEKQGLSKKGEEQRDAEK